jgi:hypothetical protein
MNTPDPRLVSTLSHAIGGDAEALASVKAAQDAAELLAHRRAVLRGIANDQTLSPSARATAERLIVRIDPAGAKARARLLIDALGGPQEASKAALVAPTFLAQSLRNTTPFHFLTLRRLEEEAERRGLGV